MTEPVLITESRLAIEVLYKMLVYVLGPLLASVVVVVMTPPKTAREWIASFISTLACSVGLGAYVVSHYLGFDGVGDEMTAMIAGGVYFLCGLPGWFVVRTIFFTMEQHRNKNILDILNSIRGKDENL